MRPMTVAELAGRGEQPTFLARIIAGDLPAATGGRTTQFELDDLTRPGFPAARQLPDADLFLDAYASLVAQRAGDEGRDATRLLRTMRALAVLSAQAVPDQRIWDAADINKATWKQYDDLLVRVHLSVPSAAFESNRLKRLTSYPKRYLCDTALALTLAELDGAALQSDLSLAGRFVESFVMQQLRPQVDQVGGTMLHLRTGAGEREVDAVIEVGRSVLGVEVRLGTRPTTHDAGQLRWLRDQLGHRFAQGLVVHTGADTYPLGERLWAVPLDVVTGRL